MAATTTKMGLTTWNQSTDDYDYQQLANNWQLVDFHDHTPGRGVPIAPGGLGAGSVLSQNIAAGVVGPQHFTTALQKDLGIGSTGRYMLNNPSAVTVANASGWTVVDSSPSLTVDAGAIVSVIYQALWKGTTTSTSVNAELGVNGTILGLSTGNGSNPPATYSGAVTTSVFLTPLATNGYGLITATSTSINAGEATTGLGQIVGVGASGASGGGETLIFFENAGTYSIDVIVGAGVGNTATVQNRHMWVRAINFE